MGRVYAVVEDSSERVLVRIECDRCDEIIKPNPDISKSGWIKQFWSEGPVDDILETYLCNKCYR